MVTHLSKSVGTLSTQEPLTQIRRFKIKPVMQEILKYTGMVITRVDHPCNYPLQDLIRPKPSVIVDPPKYAPVFPDDIAKQYRPINNLTSK